MAAASSSPPRSPGQKLRRKAPIQETVLNESTAVQRLVDYFVVVSSQPRWESAKPEEALPKKKKKRERFRRNRSKTSTPPPPPPLETRQDSEVKPSSASDNGNIHMPENAHQDHTFQPQITARYPTEDYQDNPFNPMILQFCYPTGDVITPSRSYQLPQVHHFVLTNDRGRKVYGTCLTVFEEYTPDEGPWKAQAMTLEQDNGIVELSVDNRKKALYIPKVLVLLSTWPYLTAFREYLAQIYRLATGTNVMREPIERYVVNLCQEIPAPPPGAYEVQVSILNSTIRFWAPPAKLPIAYVALPFKILFECLDFENILTVWMAMTLEHKIVLLSSQYSILTVCSEILCSLLFPMRWSHLYIPLLPKMLCPMLDAPVPYLVGTVRENWNYAQQFLSGDTIVVDLDRNSVQFSPVVPPLPAPPTKKYNKLHSLLTETVGHVFWHAHGMAEEYQARKPKQSIQKLRLLKKGSSTQWNERLGGLDNAFNLAYTPDSPNLLNDTLPMDEQEQWARVQEGFLQFFVGTLKDYGKYLSSEVDGNAPSFDQVLFLSHQKADNVPFLKEMCMTQQFDDFIMRRMYSPGEPDLVFFDQTIDAKKNRSKLKFKKVETPFLHSASAHKDLTKIEAVPPNDADLAQFEYDCVVKPFIYKKWPNTFDENLFSQPRPIPKMIIAEFDRQALLVSKLRANTAVDDSDSSDDDQMDGMTGLYRGDYDTSPEVATFTVFFFVYSAVVGRDWQTYVRRREQDESEGSSSVPQMVSSSDETEESFEVVPGFEKRAAEACISDLSLGVCDSCSGVKRVESTLVHIGREAESSYSSLFQKTVEHVVELQRRISTQEEPNKMEPDDEYDEAREVSSAQLDLAFQTLATLSLRGRAADADSYLSLMEACGRCGDTQYALKLMELMKNDGFVADSEVLASFVAAFAHVSDEGIDIGSDVPTQSLERRLARQRNGPDAYSRFLAKQFDATRGGDGKSSALSSCTLLSSDPGNCDDSVEEESCSISSTSSSKTPLGEPFLDWFSSSRPRRLQRQEQRRRRRRKRLAKAKFPVTEMLSRQLVLGESVLDFVYPELDIDTNSDSCPHCSFVLSEDDVVSGWTACAFRDYTTACPMCEHRFVPRFIVSTTLEGFEGSQGKGTPLYCEFLSPWVVRKELQSVIKGGVGIEGMLDPQWRQGTDIPATLFWNLMVLCRRYRLPFTFLLQGSISNRLILPRKPNEM